MPSGVYRGTITGLNGPQGAGIYVTVKLLNDGHAFGPCALTATAANYGSDTGDTAVGDHGAHHHDLAGPLAVGDRVLVALVAGRPNDVVILDRL